MEQFLTLQQKALTTNSAVKAFAVKSFRNPGSWTCEHIPLAHNPQEYIDPKPIYSYIPRAKIRERVLNSY